MSFVVAKGVVVEEMGEDLLVLVPGRSDVVRLTGAPAQTVRMILSGVAVKPNDVVVLDLVQRGIITGTAGLSRRGFITAGAVGAGVGITSLALPSLAAASSELLPSLSLTGFSGIDVDGRTFGISSTDSSSLGTGWPDPQPSTDIQDISALTINGTTVPVSDSMQSDNLTDPSNLILLWGPIESLRVISEPIMGTFVWKRQPFEVTFQRTDIN